MIGGTRKRPSRAYQMRRRNSVEERIVNPENSQQDEAKRVKHYLISADRGDVPAVHDMLANRSQEPFNINAKDVYGRSALTIAIENENLELMQLLLNNNIDMSNAMLQAISEDYVDGVDLLLEKEKVGKKKNTSKILGNLTDDAYPPDITALILAAQLDNYEIISLLWEKGHRPEKICDINCTCKECALNLKKDKLGVSRTRINKYKAIASPGLMCLSHEDPLTEAFNLSVKLKEMAKAEVEFKIDYMTLNTKCKDFAVALLSEIRNSEELMTILTHSEVSAEKRHTWDLPLLERAIQFKQKKFVAHPNCQQLLGSLWHQELSWLEFTTFPLRMMAFMLIALSYPLFTMAHLILPWSKLGKMALQPMVKFIMHTASYIVFILLLAANSQGFKIPIVRRNYPDTAPSDTYTDLGLKRAPPLDAIEVMILIWVVSYIIQHAEDIYHLGFNEYKSSWWNLVDFATFSSYLAYMAIRMVAFIRIDLQECNSTAAVIRLTHPGDCNPFEEKLYWDWLDPRLLSDCIYATASIISILRLFQLLTVNSHLGPLQITLGLMISDIIKWFIFFVLVMISFTCGLSKIYRGYSEDRMRESMVECAKSDRTCTMVEGRWVKYNVNQFNDGKWTAFSDWFNILQTLYWDIYGLIDVNGTKLKERHPLTEIVGKFLFGAYTYITVIVLINMLIAMMTSSYEKIVNDADMEWKFARSKLWLSYFANRKNVPAPFTPMALIVDIICPLIRCLCDYDANECSNNSATSHYGIDDLESMHKSKQTNYLALMQKLKTRYIVAKQKSVNIGLTEDDINEVRQDISSFKFQLFDIFKNNGWSCDVDLSETTPVQRQTVTPVKKAPGKGFILALQLGKALSQAKLDTEEIARSAGADRAEKEKQARTPTKRLSKRGSKKGVINTIDEKPEFNFEIEEEKTTKEEKIEVKGNNSHINELMPPPPPLTPLPLDHPEPSPTTSQAIKMAKIFADGGETEESPRPVPVPEIEEQPKVAAEKVIKEGSISKQVSGGKTDKEQRRKSKEETDADKLAKKLEKERKKKEKEEEKQRRKAL